MAKSDTKQRKGTSRLRKGAAPQVAYFIPCDAVARDPNTGKATLYGLFDRLTVKELPATAVFSLFAKLVGGNGEHEISLEVQGPGGKLARPVQPVKVDCDPDGTSLHIEVAATLRKKGKLTLAMAVDGEPAAEYTLRIQKVEGK